LSFQRHHPEDVLAGALIGAFSAWVFYHMFWPSPFDAAGNPSEARLLYTDDDQRPSRDRFELTRFDVDEIEGA